MTAGHLPSLRDKANVCCRMMDVPLCPGHYRVDAAVLDGREMLDLIRTAATMDVAESDFFGSGYLGPALKGKILMRHNWEVL